MAALQECLYSLYVIQLYGWPDITTTEKLTCLAVLKYMLIVKYKLSCT